MNKMHQSNSCLKTQKRLTAGGKLKQLLRRRRCEKNSRSHADDTSTLSSKSSLDHQSVVQPKRKLKYSFAHNESVVRQQQKLKYSFAHNPFRSNSNNNPTGRTTTTTIVDVNDDDDSCDGSAASLQLLVETIISNNSRSFDNNSPMESITTTSRTTPLSPEVEDANKSSKTVLGGVFRMFGGHSSKINVKRDIVVEQTDASLHKDKVEESTSEENEITFDADEESLESLEFLVDNMRM
eukprot:CAMPEP_0194219216 /NCGR_PEP_ID=MMETSP0156-20130528/25414_1 /TAXON_ID=33649 /ORGANISM="Thalassionema nitzschioides, Strain L26-B" /LENGTH=237 /DNA_ID=CAMNT_0038948789 /DNA_START=78 /DNA_END=791 /DNA_ORIENTATION=-